MEKTLEELRTASDAQYESNENKITSYIKALTDKPCVVSCSDSTTAHNGKDHRDFYITVEFLGEDGKRIFASDFNASYRARSHWSNNDLVFDGPALAMDCGSSGLTTRKDNPGKIYRVQLMAALWEHEDEFCELLESLPHNDVYAYCDERARLERIKREEEKQAREKKTAEVEAALVAGFEFTEANLDYRGKKLGVVTFKVDKVTPKRVYFTRKSTQPGSRYKHEITDGKYKYVGTEYGIETVVHTCYADKGSVIYALVNGGKVNSYIKGDSYVSTDLAVDRFEPAEE